MTVADTNVLVYATVPPSGFHHIAFAALQREEASNPLFITRQIMREYLAVMTRPQTWSPALPAEHALELVAGLAARFPVLEEGPRVWDELSILCRTFRFGGRQVHDANIVATMLAHGERRLLTYNTKDFVRFHSLIEVIAP